MLMERDIIDASPFQQLGKSEACPEFMHPKLVSDLDAITGASSQKALTGRDLYHINPL